MENQVITVNTGDIAAAEWVARRDELVMTGGLIAQVTCDEELEMAGKFETDCKKLIKALAAIRLNMTRPLDDAKKAICAKEKELVADIDREQKRVNVLTTAYANELARRAEEERLAVEAAERDAAEAALAAQEANDVFGLGDAAQTAPVVPTPVVTTTGPHTSSNRFVERWDFSVVDPNAVPRELCSPDPAKIRALMAAKKAEGYKAAQISVPGVRITSAVQVCSR